MDDNINDIKKYLRESGMNLCIYGEKGGGKSFMIKEILGELNYNIINVDPNESFKMEELNISNNITKHIGDGSSKNVILIDNLVVNLYDKFLGDFLNNDFVLPIILIFTSNKRIIIDTKKDFKYIAWEYPIDFYYNYIRNKLQINVTVETLDKILEKTKKDLRQINLLFNDRLDNLDNLDNLDLDNLDNELDIDYDLNYRIDYLINGDEFDVGKSLEISSADTYLLNGYLYQNYPKANDVSYSNISDCFSTGDLYSKMLYEDQYWELYNEYIVNSVVFPSYYISRKKEDLDVESFDNYKDVSYNIINSYKELNSGDLTKYDVSDLYYVSNILIQYIKRGENDIKKYKKGKNTSREEKIEISKKSQNEKSITKIVDLISSCNLYVNNNDILTDNLDKNIKNIDIKKLTRFTNIFSGISIKTSPLMDFVLKYNLILALKRVTTDNCLLKVAEKIETVNLDDIWKF